MKPADTLLRTCDGPVCFQSPAMLRSACRLVVCATLVFGAFHCVATEVAPVGYERVVVAPAKTSIYLGTVSMTMPAFVRVNGGYEADYAAKVFPFFFYNEAGRLRVEISDAALRQLARGEPIEFKGRARREDGAERKVLGKATPADATSGKIKVRVFYSKRIELIFNTTYRFPDAK
jgi:hypothetical protein